MAAAQKAAAAAQSVYECKAFGTVSVDSSSVNRVDEILKGMSVKPPQQIENAEYIMQSQSSASNLPSSTIRLIHHLHADPAEAARISGRPFVDLWTIAHQRQAMGGRHLNKMYIVRGISKAKVAGPDVHAFWKALGFEEKKQWTKTGNQYWCRRLAPSTGKEFLIVVHFVEVKPPRSEAQRGAAWGNVLLVEFSLECSTEECDEAAEAVTDLAASLAPHVELQKPPRGI